MRFHLRSLSFSAALFVASSFLSQTAAAEVKPYPSCERDPSESDVSAAKGAYEAGQVSFQEADYDRALLYWEDAFRRDCTAVKLLLNIARAYELSGDIEHAINSLQTYVDRRPDAKDRSSVEKRIEKLKERLAEQEEVPPPVTDEEPGEEEQTQEEDNTVVAVDSGKSKKPAWPVLLTGGGVLVALIGHGVIAQAGEQRAEDLGCDLDTGSCPSDAATAEANQAKEDDIRNGGIIAGVGHAAGIAGGVLWYLIWTKDAKPETATLKRPHIAPVVSPTFGGLSLSGRF